MSDRFLWYSDLHVFHHGGNMDRINDCLRVLDWIDSEAKSRNLDTIIFGGDFFHVRDKIHAIAFNRAYERIKDLSKEFKLYMIVGNHDMPMKHSTDMHNLMAFKEFVTIIDDVALLQGEKWDFFMLPYVERVEQLQWAISELAKRKNPKKKNALLAHLDIKNAWYNAYVKSDVGISDDNLSEQFDIVISGHFHNYQQLKKNIWYSGTPLQLNFGDAGLPKGILVFDDGKIEFIENSFSPKYMVIEENQIDDQVAGNFVRLMLDDNTKSKELRELIEQYDPASIEIQLKPSSQVVAEATEAGLKQKLEISGDINGLIKQWVDRNVDPGLDKNKLLSIGQNLIEAGSV